MMWVIFGHSYTFVINKIINFITLNVITNKPFYLIIEAGILSVDVFFSLGGFFLAFIMLRQKIPLSCADIASCKEFSEYGLLISSQ